MTKNGIKYQLPCVLIVGKNADEDLIFANVTDLYIFEKTLLFGMEILKATFCYHYHAFALSMLPSSSQQKFLIKYCDILHHHPYGMYYCPHVSSDISLRYVVLRSNIY